jgi:Multiubiquitin
MNGQLTENIEDIAEALHAGRMIRHHGPYRIRIGNEALQFEPRTISDPVPTGAQILEAAGITCPIEYVAYRILRNGLLEELRPDETTDLRDSGTERFIVFRTDRSFRFLLNDRSFDWGAPQITGLTLKKLAGVDLATMGVWLEIPGSAGRRIGDQEFVNLAEAGVEHFFTRVRDYHIFVNTRPKQVATPTLNFWEVVKLAFPQAEPNATTYHTVTYKRGPKSNPEGSMVAGETVHLKDGMLFNVTPTDKS